MWGEVDFLAQIPERLQVFFDSGFRLSPEAEALLAKEESRRVIAAMAEEIEKVPEMTAENYRRARLRRRRRNCTFPERPSSCP